MRFDRILDTTLDATLVGYTRLGPKLRGHSWGELAADALDGQTVVVTGATAGIGKATALRTARLGARVVVVSRTAAKVDATAAEIAEATGAEVSGAVADLSLMAEVRTLADRLLASEQTIDVLVNNAGALFPERGVTSEGLERTFALNLLGQFLLTESLIPRLVASAPARIITITSGGMYTQRISPSDLQAEHRDYDGRVQYAKTKRAQVILTEEWAKRLAGSGVVAHAMHPGWVNTPGVESGIPVFHKVMKPFLRDVDQGADTIVWLAASEAAGATTGDLWHDRRKRPAHRLSRTEETPDQRDQLIAELRRLAEI